MNWELAASIAEVVGAFGVIASLIYVARQVRASQATAADSNRLNRANGVRESMLAVATNDELRKSLYTAYGFDEHIDKMAAELNLSVDDAARTDAHNAYYFWLHWGQFTSTTDEDDLNELRRVIRFYLSPAFRYSWENSPLAKQTLDPRFVTFVETTLAELEKSET